jgi:hypothetical protein
MLVLPKWTVKKAAAYSVGDLPEKDRAEEADWLQCCHCQMNWKVLPGSGEKRGWCYSCGQVTCGKPRCQQHCGGMLHFMRKIEAIEAKGRFLAGLD